MRRLRALPAPSINAMQDHHTTRVKSCLHLMGEAGWEGRSRPGPSCGDPMWFLEA